MQLLTQEQIVAIRKASHGDGVTPWSESIAFARNIEKAILQKIHNLGVVIPQQPKE